MKYIRTGYCSYVGKAQRLFKMLCEDYILMDDILFKIRYVKENHGKPTLVLCVPERYIPIILYQTPYTFIGRTSMCNVNVSHG